jgi:dTDP-4-dehydrorhamnose 3,5-epimerase
MQFQTTAIPGVTIVALEPQADHRGFFARGFCAREFAEHGLNPRVVQTNISYNRLAGTVRGLHYQTGDAAEAKLIRCIAGEAFFAVVDLRPGPTHRQHVTQVLRPAERLALYVPEGCAVGMQTQADDTELLYQVSHFYTPSAEGGLRYDDPVLRIEWPRPMAVISDKDAAWPLLIP